MESSAGRVLKCLPCPLTDRGLKLPGTDTGRGVRVYLPPQGGPDSQLGYPCGGRGTEAEGFRRPLHRHKTQGGGQGGGREGFCPTLARSQGCRAAKFPNTPRRSGVGDFIQPLHGLIQSHLTSQGRASSPLGSLEHPRAPTSTHEHPGRRGAPPGPGRPGLPLLSASLLQAARAPGGAGGGSGAHSGDPGPRPPLTIT